MEARLEGKTLYVETAHDTRGDLSLRHSGITSLPDGLSVEGCLDLEGCIGITSLPDGLSVGGIIYKDFLNNGETEITWKRD